MSWSPAQYGKFEAERNRPIVDLLAHIPTPVVTTAIDIGCGPGNSTEILQARYPGARISGIDSSAAMIDAARERMPGIDFAVADIAHWTSDTRFDLILANAALQWLPDHEALFPRLIGQLAAGGALAVQMPDNLDEPAHVAMRDIAARKPWSAKLATASNARAPRHDADWYVRLLRDRVAQLDIWRTTYHHVLPGGPAAIAEWFKGSGLRPFLDPLNAATKQAFLAEYLEAIAPAYPVLPDGAVVLPFPRLFIVAVAG